MELSNLLPPLFGALGLVAAAMTYAAVKKHPAGEGKVVEIVDEEDPARAAEVTEHIDNLGEFYVNKRPYPNRAPGEVRVKYKVEPSRAIAFKPPG